jgi:hypothetical protein
MPTAPHPLYRDPIHDGAADPTIIWNRDERAWWLLYTNRRANVDCRGVAWAHGTDIGIASSADGGLSWRYRGTLCGLEFERGRNTFWAPEVLWHQGLYHMYASYVPGVPHDWSGPRRIIHYTSNNLWDWRKESILALSSDRVIDACVHRLPSGGWRMWYKDEARGSHIYAADSADLFHWQVAGPVMADHAQEGPNVFHWRGRYWMITDAWSGLEAYGSKDAEHWTYSSTLLTTPGKRVDDGWLGQHADVLVQGDAAYVFYFTHPGRHTPIAESVTEVEPYALRRTSLQVAPLGTDGDRLTCDRDEPFDFLLHGETE